jgi:hypothetical protein
MKPHEIIAITGIRKASIVLAIRKYISYGYTLEVAVKKAREEKG